MKRLATAFCFLIVTGIVLAIPAPPASSQVTLDHDINLDIENFVQSDFRWAGFSMGPNDESIIAQCGGLLAALATIIQNQLFGFMLPRPDVPNVVFGPFGRVVSDFRFFPPYINDFLVQTGGYKPGVNRRTCSFDIDPFALEDVGIPQFPDKDPISGVILKQRTSGLDAEAQRIINGNLLAGVPTIVLLGDRTDYDPQIIAGWDNTQRKYRVLAPLGAFSRGETFVPEPYDKWQKLIFASIELVGSDGTGPAPLIVADDPAPIEFLMTTPDGRRSGFDPTTGGILAEDDNVVPLELPGLADPFGELPPGDPAKFIAVRRPTAGAYRLSVIGTGDGPATFTISTRNGKTKTVLETFSGTVTAGSVLKYEARLVGPGTPSVTRVTNFTPEAKTRDLVRGVPGTPIDFDGSRSFDIDGSIVSYSWDFGDSATAVGSRVSHAYAAPGTYTATLTVTDNQGATGSATTTVTILGVVPGVSLERVSVSSAGREGTAPSGACNQSISGDGRFVVFDSSASNLVPGDTNAQSDVFVRDRQTGVTERVSVSSTGSQAFGASGCATISANGRFVAFSSEVALVPSDTNNSRDIYVRDRQTGTTERVSVSSTGQQVQGSGAESSISADGRFVAFDSTASGLVPGPRGAGAVSDVYVRDRLAGTTEQVSVSSSGEPAGGTTAVRSTSPATSGDGRFVAFNSNAMNLVAGLNGVVDQVFVRDRLAGTTELISVSSAGVPGNRDSRFPSMSADGRFVAFLSFEIGRAHV